MIKNYGADAVRLFILSDSPPEKDVQWSDKGMVASYKFIQKFWILHKKIIIKIQHHKKEKTQSSSESIEEFTNQTINKINISLNKFSYNVIIANLHEIYAFFNKILEEEISHENLLNNYIKILTIMIPIAPHLASECLEEVEADKGYIWPKINNKYLQNKMCNMVVQINGKKRALLNVKRDTDENEIIKEIKLNKETDKLLIDQKILKTIFVSNRLINIIL